MRQMEAEAIRNPFPVEIRCHPMAFAALKNSLTEHFPPDPAAPPPLSGVPVNTDLSENPLTLRMRLSDGTWRTFSITYEIGEPSRETSDG
jgi:hypothetical protein